MKFSIETKGFDGLESVLGNAVSNVEVKTDTMLDRLAELGTRKARMGFNASIIKDKKGNPHTPNVDVQWTRTAGGRQIVASGTDAVYSEFGVGIINTYEHQLASVVPGIDPYGRHIVSSNPRLDWLHSQGRSLGDITEWALKHGSVPSEAMYNASKEIEFEATRIAKEVYND